MNTVTFLFHGIIFVIYAYALVYDVYYIEIGWKGYGGKFKFLTFLNIIIQTVYFGLSLVNDVKGGHVRPSHGQSKSKLQKFLDVFLAAVVYPVGMFVVITFWSIYLVDRELVYPKRLDGIIPPWLNHVMHTTVLPFLLIEKYLVYREYPQRRKGLLILLGFALGYLLWILWVAYYADFWVYPILQVMEAHQRVIFIAVLMAFFISIYVMGEALNKFLWRKEITILHQRKTKAK